MVGAVQIVGHSWILCCQGVNLTWDRIVYSVYSLDTSYYHTHLFDPRLDAMIQPQLSGFPLAGSQNLSDLTVGEAILFGLLQQLLWYRTTVGRHSKKWTILNTTAMLTIPNATFAIYKALKSHPINVAFSKPNSGVASLLFFHSVFFVSATEALAWSLQPMVKQRHFSED